MIPLKDDNPRLGIPWVCYLIIAVNVAVQVAQMQMGDGAGAFLFRWGLIPWEITHLGEWPELPLAYQSVVPAVLTPFTSMFLHGGLLHLLGNMLYLFIFGDNVESIMGHGRFLAFYLCCGLLASLAHVVADPLSTMPLVGASGAIAGLLGAYLVRFPKAKIHVLVILIIFIKIIRVPAVIVLGFWFAVQLFSGFHPLGGEGGGGVAWFAHIGGFVAGVVLVFFFEQKRRLRRSRALRYHWRK